MLENLRSRAANNKSGILLIFLTIGFLLEIVLLIFINLCFIGRPSKEDYTFIISAHKPIFGYQLTFYHRLLYSLCGKHLMQIIRYEGTKAGFALLRVDPIWHIHFCRIGILEPFQGKGLATKMLLDSATYWRSRGFQKLSVYVAKSNWRAIKAYRSAGFKTTQAGEEILYLEKMI
jgi:ribosomal protein S18 acetylase RimI-like enzyme